MKRIALAFVLVACGGGPRAPEVSLAPAAPSVTAATPATLLDCTIVGTGERQREDEDPFPFRLYASEDAPMPVLVLTRPDIAHVTWSHFPAPRAGGRGRARAAIDGQTRVRYEGFADLYGRTFTATTRMDSVDGHLWAHAGSAIDVMSAGDGEIFASVRTPFRAPSTIVVHGNCANVIYEPSVPKRVTKQAAYDGESASSSFRLFATPASARAFTTITPKDPVPFVVLEHKGEFVHVTADQGTIGIDAWVLAADVRPVSDNSRLGFGRSARPRVGAGGGTAARVSRDTPLYVGDEPRVLRGAFVERGAPIHYLARNAVMANGRELIPFDFDDLFVVAPEGERLWIAKDVVSSTP